MGKVILFSENDNVSANIDNHNIISENKNELLGIILDSILFFKDHIKNLFKKASQKLNALTRIAPYMYLEKRNESSISIWVLSLSLDVS